MSRLEVRDSYEATTASASDENVAEQDCASLLLDGMLNEAFAPVKRHKSLS